MLLYFLSVVLFALATQTWDKSPHWDGAGVEVFALVYLQIGLLCLQIIVIAAPIAISYGDSQSAGNQMVHIVSSLFHRPWLTWVAVDVTDHDYCLSRSCLLVEMTWITCIMNLETCARESEPHHTRRKVTVTSLERNRTCVSLY